jgi:hypothetical protein
MRRPHASLQRMSAKNRGFPGTIPVATERGPSVLSSGMALFRHIAIAAAWTVVGSVTSHCGPSYSLAYESESAFDHCDSLDRDPRALDSQRFHCWNRWSHSYMASSTPERVQHARTRMETLGGGRSAGTARMNSSGSSREPVNTQPRNELASNGSMASNQWQPPPSWGSSGPVVMSGGPAQIQSTGESSNASTVNAPPVEPQRIPTNTSAANNTTNTATQANSAPNITVPVMNSPTGRPPGEVCSTACRDNWNICGSRCGTQAVACRAGCDDNYRDCMRSCY